MVNSEKKLLEQKLLSGISCFFSKDSKFLNPSILDLLSEFNRQNIPAFLCGGAIRDIIFHNSVPRDLDIILDNVSTEQLRVMFAKYPQATTGLGGVKLIIKDWTVDLWPLKNTWAFVEGKFTVTGFFDYPKTTFLNIDAIAVQLLTKRGIKRKIYSEYFFEAVAAKTIEINYQENPDPVKCLIKALYLANKYNYSLGPKLADYMISKFSNMEPEVIARAYKSYYTAAFINEEKILACINNIKTQLKQSADKPVNISFGKNSSSIFSKADSNSDTYLFASI